MPFVRPLLRFGARVGPRAAFTAAVALLGAALASPGAAQVWNERGGLEISRSARWKKAPLRDLGPQHEIVLWDLPEGTSSRLRLVGGGEKGAVDLGEGVACRHHGVPARRYRPSLLSPGRYTAVVGDGDSRRELGELRVPTFRCYFNRPGDPLQARRPEDVLPEVVLQAVMARCIDLARERVDVAMSDFDHPLFLAAVERAAARGIAIRLVTDERTAGGEVAARARLEKAGVPWISNERDVKKDPMMHHKFIIVDDTLTLTGHAKADRAHAVFNQSFVSINAPAVAAIYRAEFEQMWGGSGPESVREKRRFNLAKVGPREHRVVIETDAGAREVTVVYSPELVATPDLAGRPINRKLCELIGRARHDIAFMATGFDDPDVADAMIAAHAERGVRVIGVSGHPDWTMERRPALLSLIAPPSPPADVCGSYDQTERGDYASVQNRALVIDTIDPDGAAVACFSSGPWRKGRHESDDALVCIPDREVAEQYLQHVGGTRQRAFRPLEPRMEPIEVALTGGRLAARLDRVAAAVGAEVERRPGDVLVVSRGDSALVVGRAGRLSFSNVAALRPEDLGGEADERWIALDALLPLGVGFDRDAANRVILRAAPLARVPLAPRDAAASRRLAAVAPRGEGEVWAAGLVFAAGDAEVELASPPIRTDESGAALITSDRLVALADSAPDILVKAEEGADEDVILALPDVAIGFAEAIRSWRAADPDRPVAQVLDGSWGRLGIGSLWTGWRPALGEGLVFRLSGEVGKEDLAELIYRLAAAGFHQIGVDGGFFGQGRSLRETLVRPAEKADWTEVSEGRGLRNNARQVRVETFDIGARLIQVRFSPWSSPRLRGLR